MNYQFTEIGKEYTEGEENKFIGIFDSAEWESLPMQNAPFMQGEALKAVIKEWQMNAKRVSMYGVYGSCGVYGVETPKQRIFFLDDGCGCTPLALCNIN